MNHNNVYRQSELSNRHPELKHTKTGVDSVHHSINEKPRPTS
jgi:hypothetical protein